MTLVVTVFNAYVRRSPRVIRRVLTESTGARTSTCDAMDIQESIGHQPRGTVSTAVFVVAVGNPNAAAPAATTTPAVPSPTASKTTSYSSPFTAHSSSTSSDEPTLAPRTDDLRTKRDEPKAETVRSASPDLLGPHASESRRTARSEESFSGFTESTVDGCPCSWRPCDARQTFL